MTLEGCHAHVIAHGDAPNRSLVKLAGRAGFSAVDRVLGQSSAPLDHSGGHLSFFLLHHQLGEQAMHSVIGAIRGSSNDLIRFAPLILIINDCPFELVLRYIRFGYDDVITLPERREVLVSRLANQLNRELVYFETSGYFGPDRRRMERPADKPDERRTGRHPYTRYTIIRNVAKGIRVLRKELLGCVQEAPPGRGAPAAYVKAAPRELRP